MAIALLFWFLIIRPQSRRQKEQVRMQSSLAVGDQVLLTSGFYGTLTTLLDDRVEVELAPGIVVTVARGAIGAVIPEPTDDEPHDEDEYQDDYEDEPQSGDVETEPKTGEN